MKTSIKIYNAHQIGGCITIISTKTSKIVIDFGENLPGTKLSETTDIDWNKEQVKAVFFTHYHGDHIGRFAEIPEEIPLYMGEVTYKVMLNICESLSKRDPEMKKKADILKNRKNIHYLIPNKSNTIGDIVVTPYSVDHSAFDAYMILVSANGENILHTGDFRNHGHKGTKKAKDGKLRNILIEVIDKYILSNGRKINALITEGTMMTRLGDKKYSEKEMLVDATEYFSENKYIFLKISSTNVDSLATFAKAANKNGMSMYVNPYLMKQIEVYRAEGSRYNTSMYAFENVLPFMPNPKNCKSDVQKASANKQRWYMKRDGFVIVASEREYFMDTIEEFSNLPVKTIYSMWEGYVKDEPDNNAFNKELFDFYKKMDAKIMHTSGHAYPDLIAEVINKINPTEALIPIHTEAANEFEQLDIKKEIIDKIWK